MLSIQISCSFASHSLSTPFSWCREVGLEHEICWMKWMTIFVVNLTGFRICQETHFQGMSVRCFQRGLTAEGRPPRNTGGPSHGHGARQGSGFPVICLVLYLVLCLWLTLVVEGDKWGVIVPRCCLIFIPFHLGTAFQHKLTPQQSVSVLKSPLLWFCAVVIFIS